MQTTGLGLFYVAESEDVIVEAHYHPHTDMLVFVQRGRELKQILEDHRWEIYSTPFEIFRRNATGQLIVKGTPEMIVTTGLNLLRFQEQMRELFTPILGEGEGLDKRLMLVFLAAAEARKKAGNPQLTAAAERHFEHECEFSPMPGPFGGGGRRVTVGELLERCFG